MPDTEIDDVRNTRLIESMNTDSDHLSGIGYRRKPKNTSHELNLTRQSQGPNLLGFGAAEISLMILTEYRLKGWFTVR